jgi:predicted dehydrogenase
MSPSELGHWALVGSGSTARFLLERWRLRPDFPLVALCDPRSDPTAPERPSGLLARADWHELIADPRITGVILALSPQLCAGMIRAALSAGKRTLLEGACLPETRRFGDLAAGIPPDGSLAVFHVQRADRDFHLACSAIASRRLGQLRAIRWVFCEYGLPAGIDREAVPPSWIETLDQTGPSLFDQLSFLTGCAPLTIEAWPLPETSGFQARLEYPSGLSAWIDVQRAALCGLQTGWVLEGSSGSYHRGRIRTLADDGEVLEEDVSTPDTAEDDVFSDLSRLASSRQAAQESLERAVQACTVMEAIRRSAGGRPTVRR